MSTHHHHDKWGVPVFLAGLNLFFYWKILFTNRVMFPWDAADFFYPTFSFVHEELRHLRMPLWDPYVMSGYPIIGDPEGQIFYPFTWLLVLLHPFSELPYKFVEINEILHFFLAGLFMYYLVRSFVQSKMAALFSAVLFSFSGGMVAHTEHLASIESIAWYPLIFLLSRRGLLEGKTFFTISAGLVFGINILSGHLQHSVYLGLLLFFYFIYEACFGTLRSQLWPRWIYALITIGGIGTALAMVQIIPTHELGTLSVRSYIAYRDVTNGNEPQFLWTLFLPNYFGGLNGKPQWYPYDLSFNYVFITIPGCLLALLGLTETIRRRNFFWVCVVLLCIDLALGRNGHMAWLLYHTPLINMFRNAATFFDLANFALCLVAGVGAEALFSRNLPRVFQKYLPLASLFLLFSVTVLGLVLSFGTKIDGWYHMLAVFAVVCLVATAMLRKYLLPSVAQWAILGVMIFELFFYNMNQVFNGSGWDPRKHLSRELALGGGRTLQFLRSDPIKDFRVAAFAEYPWSGNGWNVWRIPGIFGWNPVTLRRYDEYIRGFIHTSNFTLPYGGPDHNLDSSMVDMLGTKYVVAVNPLYQKRNIALSLSRKFERVFEDKGWWQTYRNKNYLSRAWFYPRAFVVPNQEQTIGLMSSGWFNGRQVLLFGKGALPPDRAKMAEELATITLGPREVVAASRGFSLNDPHCAEPLPMFAGWGGKAGDWLRYELPAIAQPGRYLLVIQYTASYQPTPALEVELQNGDRRQHNGPITLPGTDERICRKWRTADLGSFEIAEGPSRLTLTSRVPSVLQIYSLWLIRLPSVAPTDPETFSFGDFSVAANSISFQSYQSCNGFVLLNEIYYPGWEASLDGEPTEIFQADSIFRAVFVPAGTHRMEFHFCPRHLTWGAAISLLTLAGCLAYSLSVRRRAYV